DSSNFDHRSLLLGRPASGSGAGCAPIRRCLRGTGCDGRTKKVGVRQPAVPVQPLPVAAVTSEGVASRAAVARPGWAPTVGQPGGAAPMPFQEADDVPAGVRLPVAGTVRILV